MDNVKCFYVCFGAQINYSVRLDDDDGFFLIFC
jgi:hypothetical protein